MSFADLESGALPAPRKARGPDTTRALVFKITTAVASYRRLLNSLGTPKDNPTLRDHLQKITNSILQLAKDAKDKLRRAAEADKSIETTHYTTDDRSADSGKMPEQRALLAESKRREVLQLDNEIVFNEAIIEEREQAIEDIQQQIGEVHDVFKDLATRACPRSYNCSDQRGQDRNCESVQHTEIKFIPVLAT